MKEGNAAKNDVRSGFSTLTDVHAEMGDDFEDYCKRRQKEIKLAKQYGLVLDTDPSQVNDKGQVQVDPAAAAAAGETPAAEAQEAQDGAADPAADSSNPTKD